jgi:hypothetical protein
MKYSDIDGVLFNKDKTILLICPNGKENIYSIPNFVITISSSHFYLV